MINCLSGSEMDIILIIDQPKSRCGQARRWSHRRFRTVIASAKQVVVTLSKEFILK